MKRYGRCNNKEIFLKLFYESTSVSDFGRKLGYKSKSGAVNGGVSKLIRQKIDEYGLDIGRFTGQGWSRGLTKHTNESLNKMSQKKSLSWNDCFKNGSVVKNQNLIMRLVNNGKRKYVCEDCGAFRWGDKELVLELHHINEKFNDNREENLKILCPNCHSFFRKGEYSLEYCNGKCIRSPVKRIADDGLVGAKKARKCRSKINKVTVSDDILRDLVANKNIIEVGKTLDISPTSVMKLCKIRGIKIPEKSCLLRRFNVSKEELEQLVKAKSILQIGKDFGVSDNAIRKRCKIMGIDWKSISRFSHK
jgi:Zn finger protein HypA/HybF involved in hydrogenase expression